VIPSSRASVAQRPAFVFLDCENCRPPAALSRTLVLLLIILGGVQLGSLINVVEIRVKPFRHNKPV